MELHGNSFYYLIPWCKFLKWFESRVLRGTSRDLDVPWTWGQSIRNLLFSRILLTFPETRILIRAAWHRPLEIRSEITRHSPRSVFRADGNGENGWVWGAEWGEPSRLLPHSPMELWFRWSELWSRPATMTGSFPERRAGVFVRRLSVVFLSFLLFFLSSHHWVFRFLFSFPRSLFFSRFSTVLNMPYPHSSILSDERASEWECLSNEGNYSWKKKHGKKCSPPPQEKLLPLGSRWYTRSRPEWLGVATPRSTFLFASMI